jgi:RNA recognition motif. (a.k.a. RRM, RBD, or RNP domain)
MSSSSLGSITGNTRRSRSREPGVLVRWGGGSRGRTPIPSGNRRSTGCEQESDRFSCPYPLDSVTLSLVGLTNEWHRWFFPIRSLLPSLAFPTSTGFNGSPFLLDPESVLRVAGLLLWSSIVGKKLYVGNLTYNVNESDLEALFAPFGTVQSAQIIVDRDTNRSKGFGFVEMGSDAEAQAAIQALNAREHDGRNLTVNEAKPREDRGGGGGRGGYGGGGGRSGGGGGYGGGRSGGGGGYGGGGGRY